MSSVLVSVPSRSQLHSLSDIVFVFGHPIERGFQYDDPLLPLCRLDFETRLRQEWERPEETEVNQGKPGASRDGAGVEGGRREWVRDAREQVGDEQDKTYGSRTEKSREGGGK